MHKSPEHPVNYGRGINQLHGVSADYTFPSQCVGFLVSMSLVPLIKNFKILDGRACLAIRENEMRQRPPGHQHHQVSRFPVSRFRRDCWDLVLPSYEDSTTIRPSELPSREFMQLTSKMTMPGGTGETGIHQQRSIPGHLWQDGLNWLA